MVKSESEEAQARAIAKVLKQAFLSEQPLQTGAEFAAELLQLFPKSRRSNLLLRLREENPAAYRKIIQGAD